MGQFVQLMAADGVQIPAWVAQPEGPVRGALVVAQEIFGVNAHIRAVTDRLAARGFVAIAPALFTRLEPDVELGYDAEGMARGKALKAAAEALPGEGVLQDIRAAAQWVQQSSGERVGMLGFCWGGLLTWRAAQQLDELSAAVCYYGGGMTVAPEMARMPRIPVMAARWMRISRWTACRPSAMHTRVYRCICTRPTTVLTVTSVAVMTTSARCRPKTARWHFLTSICAVRCDVPLKEKLLALYSCAFQILLYLKLLTHKR